jgi:type I restriction enzyme S subunit
MIKATNIIKTGIAWIPEIPSDWDLKRGKFLFKSRKVINDKMQCRVRLGLTLNGVIDRFEGDGVGLNPNDLRTYQIFEENELVFKLIDLENKNTSRVGYVHKRGIMSPAYIRVLNNPNVNMRYFYYQYFDLYQRFVFNMIGQGVRATMSSIDLLNMPVAIPPFTVQNSIVAYLDKKNNQIEKFIRNKERLIELLEEEKQSIVRKLVTKGIIKNAELNDSNVNWIGKIPTSWTTKKIKYLGKFVSGFSFDSGDFIDKGVKVIKISNIQPMQLLWDDLSYVKESYYNRYKSFRVFKDDLVFALTRPIIKGGIKVAIVDTEEKLLINQRNAIYKPNKKLFRDWLYFVILNKDFISEFDNKIDNTGQQPNISTSDIGNLYIPYPSINEQKEIVNTIRSEWAEIDLVISKAQKEISSIKEYRETLITDLVIGKRSVPQLQIN